ncbi:hypothetical protein KY342_06740 [Candidatus Woesearchaeota archaeon]|nr:hypothetical protein [Candidatus Woesearchaeota archaeon]
MNIFETKEKPQFKIYLIWDSPEKIKKKFRSKYQLLKKGKEIYTGKKRLFKDEINVKETKNNIYIKLRIDPQNKITKDIFIICLHSFILDKLSANNCITLHSSAGILNNNVYLFSGKSGQGKSTILKRLVKNNNFFPLNEDINILYLKNRQIIIYPFFRFNKRKFLIQNKSGKLRYLYFIKKSQKTGIKMIDKTKTVYLLKLYHQPLRAKNNKIFRRFAENILAFELNHKKNEKIFKYLK